MYNILGNNVYKPGPNLDSKILKHIYISPSEREFAYKDKSALDLSVDITNHSNTTILHNDIHSQGADYPLNFICLDSCAGESIFRHKALFKHMKVSDNPLIVRGVSDDSEPMIVTIDGETIFGKVYYSENCVANILSLGCVVDTCHRIIYHESSDKFLLQVIREGDVFVFRRSVTTNTYVCDIDNDVFDKSHISQYERTYCKGRTYNTERTHNNRTNKTILTTTVENNKKKYSHRQIRDAARARQYQNNLGPCTDGELIKLITRGKLDNNRVVTQDILRAHDIWGPSLANLKGKTVSHKAEIQDEICDNTINNKSDQTMFVDLMFVNGIPYLISVFKPLEYVAISKLLKKDMTTLLSAVISHLNIVRKHGIKVPLVRVDGESAISSEWFQSKISAEGTILDTTGAGEAVTVVERKIRLIKERLRGIINTIPYRLTEQLETWLLRYVVSRINLVPTRNNPDYISPREKLWGRRINVDKELKHGYGDYVQVHTNNVDNSMKERTSGALALMPSGNLEGSWYYYLLSNNDVVKRNKATNLPITDDIINYLNIRASARKTKIHTLNKPVFEIGINHHIVDEDAYIEPENFSPDHLNSPEHVRTDNSHTILQDLPIETEEYSYVHDEIQNDPDNIRVNDFFVDDSEENSPHINQEMFLNIENNDDNIDSQNINIRGDSQEYIDSISDIQQYNKLESEQDIDSDIHTYLEPELIPDVHTFSELELIPDVHTYSEPELDLEPETDLTDIAPDYTLQDNVHTLRRSNRNHQLNRWNKRIVGLTNIVDISRNKYDMNYDILRRTYALNMTVSQGIDKLGFTAIKSVVTEMIQMTDLNVLVGVDIHALTQQQKSRIITSSMFLKEKFTADGKFDKLKSRLVAGGHLQDREIYTNGASPTVATTSVFIVAAIAAKENRAVAAIDFPGAFLNSVMPEKGDHVVLMRLNKFLTYVLIQIDPTFSKYVQANGTCVVRLNKVLYGCVESAAMWYDKISNDLMTLGYTINKLDMCVFNRLENDNTQTTLILHVDDMKISSTNELYIDQVIEEIETLYPGLTKQRGRVINYLGMTFDYSIKGQVKITMSNYVTEVLQGCSDMLGTAHTPAHSNLFNVRSIQDSPELSDEERETFHSITAQLLYLAKRVRPDLLVVVSFLTKRVLHPQRDDRAKLVRAVQYLRGTRDLGIILSGAHDMTVLAYVDASYGVHEDLKSHTGCTIGIGLGPIFAKSTGQKINTKSSTEAELIALSDSSSQIIWTRNFIEEQGYRAGPALIYEDNMSTISLVKNGKSNSEKTRHISIRFFFISDRIKSKEITVEYMPTGDMIADILTKPLQGALFRKLRDKLLNWS